jgi:TrmH family RNA methyltransferase
VGAILRTIDAVGADGLILIDGGVDAYHPTAVRASMGALFRHPVVTTSFPDYALWATENGYHVYGSSARGDLDIRQVTGFCEQLMRLPMKGEVTSLNLAVAAGVLLYGMLGEMDGT